MFLRVYFTRLFNSYCIKASFVKDLTVVFSAILDAHLPGVGIQFAIT